jgi:hypothetical protein
METQSSLPPAEKHKHAAEEKRNGVDAVKKWLGLAAALLSLGSAVYGRLTFLADQKARAHEVTELVATSHTEEAAGDHAAAWQSLQRAIPVIDAQRSLVKLFGGLDKEQVQVHAAQEDLGMEWLRALRGSTPAQGHMYAEGADVVIPVLSAGAEQASGSHKADLLAHIGWAYFLKVKDGVKGLQPEGFFRQALAVEAANPYAETFLGYSMVLQVPERRREEISADTVAQAQSHFVTALSSKRTVGPLRAWVRELQFAAFNYAVWWRSQKQQAIWWQAVNDMYKAGEPFEARLLLNDLQSQYTGNYSDSRALESLQRNLDSVLQFAPIEEHLKLLHLQLDKTSPNAPLNAIYDSRLVLFVALANALERAGEPVEALAAWRDAQARKGGPSGGTAGLRLYNAIDAAVARLSAAGTAHD